MMKSVFLFIILMCLVDVCLAQTRMDSLSEQFYKNAPPAPFSPPSKPETTAEPIPPWEKSLPVLKNDTCDSLKYDNQRNCSDQLLQKEIKKKQLKIGWEAEREQGIEGTVYIRFVISKEGKMTKVEIAKNMTASEHLGAVALEALKELANELEWHPAKKGNQAVDIRMVVPVKFRLD